MHALIQGRDGEAWGRQNRTQMIMMNTDNLKAAINFSPLPETCALQWDNFTKLNVTKSVTIQPLAVGRAARAINGLARSPRAGEGARSTPLYLNPCHG